MHYCSAQPASNEYLPAENILRLHVVCSILHLQHIIIEIIDESEQLPILRLRVPEAES
jgi:hypothetical protein